jgi:predicted DNA-binding ribbon-helix-helix protein
MARLQAHLRRTESLHAPARPVVSNLRRTTVRLPAALLDRLRDRARRDSMTVSEVVELAVERFLRSR